MGSRMASPNDTQKPAVFLSPAQLSERWLVTPMTLRRWRHAGKLKTHHLGRGIRFSMAEIERIEREAIA